MRTLFLLLTGILITASAIAQPASVEVNGMDGGALTDVEREFLHRLERRGIPVPDSVVIVQTDDRTKGWRGQIVAPNTVHLTTGRREHPNDRDWEKWPYLFGREQTAKTDSVKAHILSHELAHVLGRKLDAKYGRPALGLHTKTDEIQAEILSLVLDRAVFGWTADDLGYPKSIHYPMIDDKSTRALERKYCFIVQKTWDVQSLDCSYGK